MFAANWDASAWDEHKCELWLGMLQEIKYDGTPLYSAREALWAARYLIREHRYPRVQFSDFHAAVLVHRRRVRERAEYLKDRADAALFAARTPGRLRSMAKLLHLAAPRKMP